MENTELAKLVLKQVDAFPESFWMATWGEQRSCGTVACLAGHAMLLSGYRLVVHDYAPGAFITTYERPDGSVLRRFYGEEAQQLLGMTDRERFNYKGADNGDIFLDIHHGLDRFRRLAKESG